MNIRKRLIYAFEFPDNYVYVGLTGDLNKRKSQHLSLHHKSYVYKHMIKTNLTPKVVKLSDFLNPESAKIMENQFLENYSKKNWHILNKAKTGGLGGNIIKHTKIACKRDAKKYQSRREWYEKSPSSYDAARRNKWIDECCTHMVSLKKPNGYWTRERCIKNAKKYKTRGEWQLNSKTIYGIACKNSWLNDCCSHMILIHKINGYWTKMRCIKDAKKYKTTKEWSANSVSAYSIAKKNKWLNECRKHMIILRLPNGYWTKNRCMIEAKKYKTRIEWQKFDSRSYSPALKNNWLNECCKHMKNGKKIKYMI
jgi:predicted GIY-YIG superfamily endonuclease